MQERRGRKIELTIDAKSKQRGERTVSTTSNPPSSRTDGPRRPSSQQNLQKTTKFSDDECQSRTRGISTNVVFVRRRIQLHDRCP